MTEQELIDNFLSDIESAQKKLINKIELALKKGYFTDVELAQLSAEIDFYDELVKGGYSEGLEKYLTGYEEIAERIFNEARLRGVSGITSVSLADLDTLIDIKGEELLGKARLYGSQIKSALFNNLISGTPQNEIIESLSNIPLKDNQLIAAVNTGVAEFERTAMARIYEESPDQRFILVGPKDVRTRASCEAVLNYQPKEGFTKKEIDEGAATELVKKHAIEFANNESDLKNSLKNPYTFADCGKWNCRHRWKPI